MISRLHDVKIRTKIGGAFAVVVALLLVIAGVGYANLESLGRSFHDYESISDESQLIGAIRADVRDLQIAVRDFALRPDEERRSDVMQAHQRFKASTEAAVARIEETEQAAVLSEIAAVGAEYADAFATMAGLTMQREQLVRETLDKVGETARANLTKIAEMADRENDAELTRAAGRAQESLLVARLAMMRFLERSDGVLIEQALAELKKIPAALDLLEQAVVDPALSKTLNELRGALPVYETAIKRVVTTTAERDEHRQLLERIGDIVLKHAGALQSAFAAEQNERKEESESVINSAETVLAAVAAIALAVGIGFSVLIARSIAGPVMMMTKAMQRLAAGDVGVEVPGRGRKDELGAMASAVQVFKDHEIERERVQAAQEAEQVAKTERAERIDGMIAAFDERIASTLRTVSAAATELDATAQSMVATAHQTDSQAGSVAAASNEASANVQTVAAATEQLSASIAEIGSQVTQSSRMTAQAVVESQRAGTTVQSLAGAARKIGDVVGLISNIASQTNLLALNATIEAARAGEAGKGFAVVASEVKALATQTAKATDEIAMQIAAMQSETDGTVAAIDAIRGVIGEVEAIATTIASAIEEQNAATAEISRNVQEASRGTEQVSASIGGVSEGATATQAAASQVLSASGQLAQNAEELKADVERFVADIRAA